MKTNTLIKAIIGIAFAAIQSQAGSFGSSGSISAVGGQVAGTITVTSTSPGGCPTRVCTTNWITYSHCYTNTYWKVVCTTNAGGAISCTNVPVTVSRCFTNTFPEITCTNSFPSPVSLRVLETLSGALSAGACNELGILFPSNAMFQASLSLNVRTNDWVGTQSGGFKITAGTNTLAIGSLTGVNGLSTEGACAVCNGFQGTLRGTILVPGPMRGAQIQAAYAGALGGVGCPSAEVPAGAVQLVFDGVVAQPCFSAFSDF